MKDYRILSLTAVMVFCLAAFAGVAMAEEDDAISDHGSSSSPLDSFTATGTQLNSDSNNSYYVKVGGSVSITMGSSGSYSYYPNTVTSGYGLTKGIGSVSGTISKEGTISIGLVRENANGNVSTVKTITIYAVNASSSGYTESTKSWTVGTAVSEVVAPGDSWTGSVPGITFSSHISAGTSFVVADGTPTTAGTYTITTNGNYRVTITVTGSSTPSQYTCYLYYNANGGSGAPSTQSYTGTSTSSHSFTVASGTPTKSGYTFLGWATSSGATTASYQAGSSISVSYNGSKTLYAVWQEEVTSYTFTVYKGNYGSFWVIGEDSYDTTASSKTYTVDAGTKVYIVWYGAETETSGTQASGKVTTVSYNDCDMIVKNNSNYPGGGTDRVTVEDGAKYYPAYAMDSTTSTTYYFKVSYNANGGSGAPSTTDGGSSSSSSKSVTLSSTVPTRPGYTFLGWSASSTATSANYQPGSAYTFSYGTTPLYAVWKESSYTCYLAFNANGGSGAPNQLSFTGSSTSNHTFSIPNTVPTRSGYTFKGWADSSSATSPQYSAGGSISVGYNVTKTIYAVWEKNTLAIGSVSKQYAVVGEGVSFTASCSPSSGVSYGYSNATSGLTVSVNGNSITLNASNPGTYTFTLTASKTNYSSSSTTVTVEFVPELAFSNTPAQGTLTVW